MAMEVSPLGKVGPLSAGEATESRFRQGRTGEIITSDAHGRFYEATVRGKVFWVADQAAKTMPAGLSAVPTTVTLANPAGSGVNAVVLFAYLNSLLGFAAAAEIWIAANLNPLAAAVTGTAAVPVNGLIGGTAVPSVKAFTTATLPAVPVGIVALGAAQIAVGTGTMQSIGREFAGSLVVAPGGALSFQASTASGAGEFGEWCWEEVPV